MPTYYFLPDDFQALNEMILRQQGEVRTSVRELGRSTDGESNSWHDNFAYDDANRRATMHSDRLRELMDIRNNAQVVTYDQKTNRVAIGAVVTIENQRTKEIRTFRIGSFWVSELNSEKKPGERPGANNAVYSISYGAPLARIIIGARAGEVREGKISDETMRLKVVKISG